MAPPAPLMRLPLLRQLQQYDATTFRGDVIAGLTTAVMLTPQAMAYAMLAGLDPIVGLYASTAPLLVYGVLGTSRQLAVGPVAMFSLLVAAAVAPLAGGVGARAAALAGLMALLVGVIQLGMGVVRLGFLVRLLSHPILAGFTSAAAIVIGASQLQHVFGIKLDGGHNVLHLLAEAAKHLGDAKPLTVSIAVTALVVLRVLQTYAPRFPRFLFVVVAGTLAVWGLGLDAAGVAIVGAVPAGLPSPTAPILDLEAAAALLPAAFTLALVAFMESISVAKSFARKHRYDIDADQELVALGLANVAAAFVRGYPVTGGFSRTAVNAQAGARTGVAALVTAAAIVLTLLFLTPLFTYLPKAVLAAIILSAVAGLVAVDEAKHLWTVSKGDAALMAITFVATLALDIELGIAAGVAASLVAFIWRTSLPHVATLGQVPGRTDWRNLRRYPDATTVPGVVALRVDGPVYFANCDYLKNVVAASLGDDRVEHLILDCKGISSVDAQALSTFSELLDDLDNRGTQLWLTGVRGPVRDAFDAAHIFDRVGRDHVLERVFEAAEVIRGRSRAA